MTHKSKVDEELLNIAAKIKLLLMDCDGVMTDGRLYFTENGEAMKVFHVRDGQGLALWHKAGFSSGIITGRGAEKILEKRATELGIDYIKACSLDKASDFEDILQQAGVTADEVAFIGDDVGDISIMKRVGLPIAVADAVSEVLPYVLHRTVTNGGGGAVREVTDWILEAKRQFQNI
jgi:3-deoxy-D-manno-octulosonate 8-phosphate phosphatase (KDO 8-P phosphatase)